MNDWVCAFVRARGRGFVGACTYVGACVRVCLCTRIMHALFKWVREEMRACICTSIYIYIYIYIDTSHLHILHTSYMITSQNKKTRRGAINVLVVLKSAEVFRRGAPTHDVSLPLCVASLAMSHTHLGVGVRWIYLILSQTPKAP